MGLWHRGTGQLLQIVERKEVRSYAHPFSLRIKEGVSDRTQPQQAGIPKPYEMIKAELPNW